MREIFKGIRSRQRALEGLDQIHRQVLRAYIEPAEAERSDNVAFLRETDRPSSEVNILADEGYVVAEPMSHVTLKKPDEPAVSSEPLRDQAD